MKAHARLNSHRLRGKRYLTGIGCNLRRKVRGRRSAEIQSDPDGARGKEGFAFGLRKTGETLVGMHRENVFTLIQPPSRRQRLARRDAQSNGGCASRVRRGDLKRGFCVTHRGRQIHRGLRIRRSE